MSDADASETAPAVRPDAGAAVTTDPAAAAHVGSRPERIGPYTILELLGEGGMGEVYKAEQRVPIRRVVAIKIIKLGFNSREIIARFESERQALARMDHPNVARVLDAGVADNGRPYFVMEYVPGKPIQRFCDDNKLSVRQRLELFRHACDAIAHAHTKAIIHRDIKGSNVLAYFHDGRPAVKVIDFGIAKACSGERLGEATVFTDAGMMMGTFDTMSPEQAEGWPDIDTRTDVYSLGVLLYELLAGAKPFERKTFAGVADAEIRRIIREVEPPRPATRLSGLGEDATKAAERRQTRLEQLVRDLKRELEWIPLKAMRKERNRRYASVAELSQDIENYLAGRPLLAGPDSRVYRLRKFARKRAVPLVVAALFLVTIVGLSALYVRSLRAEQRRTSAALVEARQQRDEAQRQQTLATQTRDFLIKTLQSQDPMNGGRQDTLVSEAMQRSIESLDRGTLATQPELQAALLVTIADILNNNGAPERAEPLAERSLEIRQRLHPGDDADVALSMSCLANIRLAAGHPAQAEPLCRASLEMLRRLHPGDQRDTVSSIGNLAMAYRLQNRLGESEQLYREALEMSQRLARGGDAPDVALALDSLGGIVQLRGRINDAEPLYRQALEMTQRIYKSDHPDVARDLNNLAFALGNQKRFAEAELLLQQSLDMGRRLYKTDHPQVAMTMNNLAFVRHQMGHLADAEPLFRETLAIRRRLFKGDHPDVAQSLNNLANIVHAQHRDAEAEQLYDEALRMYQRLYPYDHLDVARTMSNLASIRMSLGRLDDAEGLYREALRMRASILGADSTDTRRSAGNLAALLTVAGKKDDAARVIEHYKISASAVATLASQTTAKSATSGPATRPAATTRQ